MRIKACGRCGNLTLLLLAGKAGVYLWCRACHALWTQKVTDVPDNRGVLN